MNKDLDLIFFSVGFIVLSGFIVTIVLTESIKFLLIGMVGIVLMFISFVLNAESSRELIYKSKVKIYKGIQSEERR